MSPLTHLTRPISKSTWALLFIIGVSMLLMTLSSVMYSNHLAAVNAHQTEISDHRWCHLMATLDDAYKRTPPQTPSGKAVAADIHEIHIALHCTKDEETSKPK